MLGVYLGLLVTDLLLLIFCPSAAQFFAKDNPGVFNVLNLLGLLCLIMAPILAVLSITSYVQHRAEMKRLTQEALERQHQRSERGYDDGNRQRSSARTPRQPRRQPRYQPEPEQYLDEPDYGYPELSQPNYDPYGGFYGYSARPQQRRIAEPVEEYYDELPQPKPQPRRQRSESGRQWNYSPDYNVEVVNPAVPKALPKGGRVQGVPEYLNPTGTVSKVGSGKTLAELANGNWYWIERKMEIYPDGFTVEEKD